MRHGRDPNIIGHEKGHPIYLDEHFQYRYTDTNEGVNYPGTHRLCKHCEKPPTKEGYDACLGHLKDVQNACCGHGRPEDAFIQYNDGSFLRNIKAIRKFPKEVFGNLDLDKEEARVEKATEDYILEKGVLTLDVTERVTIVLHELVNYRTCKWFYILAIKQGQTKILPHWSGEIVFGGENPQGLVRSDLKIDPKNFQNIKEALESYENCFNRWLKQHQFCKTIQNVRDNIFAGDSNLG